MSEITVICGDCAQVLKTFEPDCIDLTVTSPPYDNLRTYNGYVFDFETIAQELYRVTKPGGVVVWVVGDATINGSETGTSFRQALYFMGRGFNLHDTMIWSKGGFTATGSLASRYAPVFEFMLIFSKGYPKTFNPIMDRKTSTGGAVLHGVIRGKNGKTDRRISNEGKIIRDVAQRFNIWEIPNPGVPGQIHPAVFPEDLARDHILSWSNPGDTVLDPMAGSGTTLKMAKMLQRRAIGIEISPEYCKLINRRLEGTLEPLGMRIEP